jgi:hypothetical protein
MHVYQTCIRVYTHTYIHTYKHDLYKHKQISHVFAREAGLMASIHASSGGKASAIGAKGSAKENEWVVRVDVLRWWTLLRDVQLSDSVHVHQKEADKVGIVCVIVCNYIVHMYKYVCVFVCAYTHSPGGHG